MKPTRDDSPRIAWLEIEPCPGCGRTNQVCAKPPGALRSSPCESCRHPVVCHAWS